jgi:predicted amidophosphoribosyltransferase
MAPDNFAPSLLIRQRNTPSQAGKNRQQRIDNVRGAFAVPAHQKPALANRPIMLIDDVMTTGATLFEAAKTLQMAGAGPICGLVIARVT